jgi:hypothetical protein
MHGGDFLNEVGTPGGRRYGDEKKKRRSSFLKKRSKRLLCLGLFKLSGHGRMVGYSQK